MPIAERTLDRAPQRRPSLCYSIADANVPRPQVYGSSSPPLPRILPRHILRHRLPGPPARPQYHTTKRLSLQRTIIRTDALGALGQRPAPLPLERPVDHARAEPRREIRP